MEHNFNAHFRCIAGCGETYPLDEIVYSCRKCGNLLEVHHDIGKLESKKPGPVAGAL